MAGDADTAREVTSIIRTIARQEVASLCGLVLNRLGDVSTGEFPLNQFVLIERLESIFGEALRDFSTTTSEPGPEPA